MTQFKKDSLDIKPEQNDVAIDEEVFFAFLAHFAGVFGPRLTAVGKGESQPIADNATDAGRARNRRVDVLIKGQ